MVGDASHTRVSKGFMSFFLQYILQLPLGFRLRSRRLLMFLPKNNRKHRYLLSEKTDIFSCYLLLLFYPGDIQVIQHYPVGVHMDYQLIILS